MTPLPAPPPSFDPKQLGARIKARREHCGWSLTQLAHRSGIDRQTIWRIEQGQGKGVYAHTFYALCLALGCSADSLLALSVTNLPTESSVTEEVPSQTPAVK